MVQKTKKTVKIKVKLTHVNKKSLARKQFFVQTTFSHSTFKFDRKISGRKTTCFFVQIPFSHSPLSLERTILRRKTTRFFAPLPILA